MGKTIELTEQKLMVAYAKGDQKEKTLLENLYGKEQFYKDLTERVKTVQDALSLAEISPEVQTLLDYKGNDKDLLSSQAHAILTIVVRVLNEGWVPDYTNSNEAKYEPRFEYKCAAGWVCNYYADWGTSSHVGSRLVFRTPKLAEYAGTQFQAVYNRFLG